MADVKYFGLSVPLRIRWSKDKLLFDYSSKMESSTVLDLFGKDLTCMELGAADGWLGSNCHLFGQMGNRIVFVEPDPRNWQVIEEWNNMDRILLKVALGKQNGEASMRMGVNRRSNSLEGTNTDMLKEGYETVRVKVWTFDEVVRNSLCPDFLSVDIEGMELEFIDQLKRSSCQPRALILEWTRIGFQMTVPGYELVRIIDNNMLFRRHDVELVPKSK